MTKIKICGIYREEDTNVLNEVKPDYFGMILNFPKSHRNISYEKAVEIREKVNKEIKSVGVFVNATEEFIASYVKNGTIDIVQLHGSETEEDIRRLQRDLKVPVWKAFKVQSEEDLKKALNSPADKILLDNGYGTGKTFDWSYVTDFEKSYILAGGLNPENIADAIHLLKPEILDISSGVETDKVKDPEKIRKAIEIAHRD